MIKNLINKIALTIMCLFAIAPNLMKANATGCPGFLTYTQGGWGATPKGNNAGTYLYNNFSAAFPNGITIGCTNKLVLTSAAAVHNFLPQGSTASMLPSGVLINPTSANYTNVLAGQLVATMLNVGFDAYSASFGSSNLNLKDLVITDDNFFNMTVQEFINEANMYIGGCATKHSAGEYNSLLDDINNAYEGGQVHSDHLACPIQITSSITNVSCFGGNNGSISLTSVFGGVTSPYTFKWSTGATTNSISGLTAGNYSVLIKDGFGLSKTFYFTVAQPTLLVASSSAPAILCHGGTASVTVSAVGGTAPYSGTGTYTKSAGTYSYTVTDANGCSSTTSVTVTEPTQLVASSSAPAILCHGGTATVTVSAVGGTAPYSGTGTYTKSAGTYSYTVTDANGCTATTSVTVIEPSLLVASSSAPAILCNGGTATVTVSALGGTAAYSGTGTYSKSAGTYSYIVTDANGCTATTSVTVTEPTKLVASSSAPTILCNGGTATVTVSALGGTAAYSGTGTYAKSAGTYSYTVTDANGCTATTSVTVTEPTKLVASSSAPSILCHGGTTTVTVSALGGTAAYSGTGTYAKSAGTYSYTVTDANSCTATTSVTVTEPSAIVLVATQADSKSCSGEQCSGSATIAATGGTGNYKYTWTNVPTVTTTSTATGLCSGSVVSVSVKDDNGCTAANTFGAIQCVATSTCSPLKTYTQGGWGSKPSGNNPGTYLAANFAKAFPTGVTVGSAAGYQLKFTSATNIQNFLPAGGSPVALTTDLLNPIGYKNTFAAQVLALTLNVGFDNYSAAFANNAGHKLKDMYIGYAPFVHMTVAQLLVEANKKLGGVYSVYSINDLNNAIARINGKFDNGEDNGDDGEDCEDHHNGEGERTAIESVKINTVNLFPNPAYSSVNVQSTSNNAIVTISDITGKVMKQQLMVEKQAKVNLDGFKPGIYFVTVVSAEGKTTQKLMVK